MLTPPLIAASCHLAKQINISEAGRQSEIESLQVANQERIFSNRVKSGILVAEPAFGLLQFYNERNELLQLPETLDRCELQIFANQRDINVAIVTVDCLRMSQHEILCRVSQRCFCRSHKKI